MNTQPSLQAPPINVAPGAAYAYSTRRFQGIPGYALAPNGREWAIWYAGGPDEPTEGPGNYVAVATRGPGAAAFTDPVLVIDPPGRVRAYDAVLWFDPQGRMWLFWAQSYEWFDGRSGTWAMVTNDASSPHPTWSAPRRIGDGIMMNKPTVLSSGEWLLPLAVWPQGPHGHTTKEQRRDLPDAERGAHVYVSRDQGASFAYLSTAPMPQQSFAEHMIVERRDGSLWMLVRCFYGIGESVSHDRGRTWTPGQPSPIPHVDARFFIRRLVSGNLLLVRHAPLVPQTRSHLSAFLSADDGHTWQGGLLLDERAGVSYPDGIQRPDGLVTVIYDYNRTTDKHLLLATFSEADVLAGKVVTPGSRLAELIIPSAVG